MAVKTDGRDICVVMIGYLLRTYTVKFLLQFHFILDLCTCFKHTFDSLINSYLTSTVQYLIDSHDYV